MTPPPTDNNKRFLLPVAQINDSERIRKDYGDISELADSIANLGLLQPIVVKLDGTLIAGGRRLRAMRKLGWADIPVTFFEVADEVTLRILEVEENVRRKPMSWQERVLAIAMVHEKQLITKALLGISWPLNATGELLGMSKANISYALNLAVYIRRGDKEVEKCEKMWDAINLLIKRQAEESNKLLAKMTLPAVDLGKAHSLLTAELGNGTSDDIFTPVSTQSSGGVAQLTDDPNEMPGGATDVTPPTPIKVPLSQMILLGDCLDILMSLPGDSFDHIVTDPVYAIDMGNIDQKNDGASVAGVAAEHKVEDNLATLRRFIPLAYRAVKPNGFCIMWADPMMWQFMYDQCIGTGFKVQRWPLIWHKTHRCGNQAANYNFTKDYEIAIVCRKGNATLLTPQASSIYMGATDDTTRSLAHPFAKPPKLWQWLYAAVAHKGQLVLDPFGGVGSSTLAAIEYGISPISIELNETHHAGAIVNVAEWYRKNLKNVSFT